MHIQQGFSFVYARDSLLAFMSVFLLVSTVILFPIDVDCWSIDIHMVLENYCHFVAHCFSNLSVYPELNCSERLALC